MTEEEAEQQWVDAAEYIKKIVLTKLLVKLGLEVVE
jgi:hypothetical protein